MPELVTRKVAQLAGLRRYFTGKPCKYGHVAERFVCDKSCAECRNINSVQWKKDNKEKVNISWRARYHASHEHYSAKYIQKARNRRGISDGTATKAALERLLKMQKFRCAYCKCKLQKSIIEVDHIIPVFLGGMTSVRNLQILCRTCNKRKSAKLPHEFARECGLLI